MNPLFGFIEGITQPTHLLLLLIIGILLFGKRLPEVGRQLGKGIVEFKKGLKGLEDDLGRDSSPTVRQDTPAAIEAPRPPQRVAPPAATGDVAANPPQPSQRVVPPAPTFDTNQQPTVNPPQA
jgi:sec-independent protein translocase protein TatA